MSRKPDARCSALHFVAAGRLEFHHRESNKTLSRHDEPINVPDACISGPEGCLHCPSPAADVDLFLALASASALYWPDRRPGVYVILFLKELWHLIGHSFDFSEQQIMLVVLGLIDVVMISNL